MELWKWELGQWRENRQVKYTSKDAERKNTISILSKSITWKERKKMMQRSLIFNNQEGRSVHQWIM